MSKWFDAFFFLEKILGISDMRNLEYCSDTEQSVVRLLHCLFQREKQIHYCVLPPNYRAAVVRPYFWICGTMSGVIGCICKCQITLSIVE